MNAFTERHRLKLHDPACEPNELALGIRAAAADFAVEEIPRIIALWAHPHVRVRAEVLAALIGRFEKAEWIGVALDAMARDKALFDHAADASVLAYAARNLRDAPAILRGLARIALARREESSPSVERVARDIEGIAKMLETSSALRRDHTQGERSMEAVWQALERIVAEKSRRG